jgi:hemerythrin-like metal-binding domain
MGFMSWSKEYEFDIPEMDQQHKKWLEILNKFYDHLENENMRSHLHEMITEAVDYTHYHFQEEEKLMLKIGYHDINEQKRMHKEIVNKIEAFQNKIKNGEPIVTMTLTSEFKNWFKNHILVEDKKYAEIYHKLNSKHAHAS